MLSLAIRAVSLVAMLCSAQPLLAQNDGGFPHGVLSSANGRFVFGQVSRAARHQYMLDTATGRLWQIACLRTEADKTECGRLTFEAVTYSTESGAYSLSPPGVKP